MKALFGRTTIIFSAIFLLWSSQAFAASGITYHGRLLRPNASPVDGQFVGFRLRVMDGNTGSCQMYEETRTKDMRLSNGSFAIVVGDGAVPGTYGVSGISLFDELFVNNKTFTFNGGHPCVGSPYAADIRGGRILNVSFRESPADPWEDLPSMTLAHVPFSYSSLVSQKVGLHDSGSLLRVENAGAPSAAAALTPANFTELLALLNGTTTQYVKTVAAVAGQTTVSNIAGTATVGLADVATVTAGSYGSSTQVPVFTVDAKGRITGVTNTNIAGGGGGGITDLTGDVTASGTGSVAATIANSAVTTAKINNLAVDDTKLAANSVITAKILDANVTLNKLAADSVNSAKILDNSITGADILNTAALSVASVAASGNVGAGTMSTRSIGLFELPGNGTESITLQAPAALAGNVVYTLPATDGASGDVLSTNSAGVLSWATPGSPGNATYAAKGVVQFDTDAATSGITVAAGVAKIATGGVATGMLADDVVSFAKMQNIATNKLLGRGTALSGDVEEITLGTGLSFTGTTLNATVTDSFAALPCGNGYLPYRDAGAWTCKQVTSANTNDAIVTRDSSGNFIAGTGQFSTSVKITDGAAGGQVTIAAPGTFTSYNLTLPVDDGGVDQVLKTNGSGVLSWVNQPTVTGMIVDGGNTTGAEILIGTNDAQKLSFETANTKAMTIDATGKVGIGTATPNANLSINTSNADTNLRIRTSSTGANSASIQLDNYSAGGAPNFNFVTGRGTFASPSAVTTSDILGQIQFWGYGDTTSRSGASIIARATATGVDAGVSTKLVFGTASSTDTAPVDRMTILPSGNVGIGATNPSAKLEVAGDISAYNIYASNIPSGRIVNSPGGTAGYWVRIGGVTFNAQSQYYSAQYAVTTGANGSSRGINAKLYFRVKQLAAMGGAPIINVEMDSSNSLLTKSDVVAVTTVNSGAATTVSFYIRTQQDWESIFYAPIAAGGWTQVHDYDPSAFLAALPGGTQTVATAGSGLWSIDSGTNITYSGNVGIGTTAAPNGKLDVKGSVVMSGATSGYVGFQPATNAGSVIYTLPSADGGNGDVLKTNGSGVLSWTTIAGGGGEANTASNVGAGGVGVYKSKTGVNIDLKNINAGSNKISVTDDAGNSEVDIDINEANLTLSNLGGTVPLSKGGTNANITAVNNGIVYSTATAMAVTAAGNNGVLVTSAGGVPSISSTIPNATQDNITRTGTITSGTWSATAISGDKGGTGQTSYTVGDMLYASSTSALSKLSAGATAGHVLSSAGAGAAPVWQAVPLSSLGNAGATRTLANANFAQVWNWDTLSTQTAMQMASNSGTTGTILNLTNSYNNASSTGNVLKTVVSGASSAAVPVMVTNAGTGLSLRVNDDGTDTDSTPFAVNAAGNVGIGTATPATNTKLEVIGQIRTPATSTASGTIDFSGGNIVTTSYNCAGSISFANLRDGGSYTLIVTSTATTQCSFSATSTGDDAAAGTLTYRFVPANGLRTASSHSIYSLMRVGTVVYVSWITGF